MKTKTMVLNYIDCRQALLLLGMCLAVWAVRGQELLRIDSERVPDGQLDVLLSAPEGENPSARRRSGRMSFSLSQTPGERKMVVVNPQTRANAVLDCPALSSGGAVKMTRLLMAELRNAGLGDANAYACIFAEKDGDEYVPVERVDVSVPQAHALPLFRYGTRGDLRLASPTERKLSSVRLNVPMPIFADGVSEEERERVLDKFRQEAGDRGDYRYEYTLPNGDLTTYSEDDSVEITSGVNSTTTVGNFRIVDWDDDTTRPATATQIAPINASARTWDAVLGISHPVYVKVGFADLEPHVLGSTYWPETYTKDGIQYPAALIDQLMGEDMHPSRNYDIRIRYSTNYDFYYGTDGNCPSSKQDLMSTASHELCHGLGFVSYHTILSIGYPDGTWDDGRPSIFDTFLYYGTGRLTDLSQLIRLEAFTSGALYWDGPNAKSANGGSRVKMYAPARYDSGSSIAHWDDSVSFRTFMKHSSGRGEVCHEVDAQLVGALKDMGWPLKGEIVLSSLSISGASSVTSGGHATYSCTASYSDGTVRTVTPNWSISHGLSYASINSSGVLTASSVTSAQSVTVRASYTDGGVMKTATKSVTVNPIQGPANDDFLSAVTISGNSGSTSGSNVGATSQNGEPLLSNYSTATTTVWWKWTAPTSGRVTIDTVGSSFDTQTGIYTGSSLSSLYLETKDDDSGANQTSVCTFDCTVGTTYYICVGGYQGRTGTIKLNWSLTSVASKPDLAVRSYHSDWPAGIFLSKHGESASCVSFEEGESVDISLGVGNIGGGATTRTFGTRVSILNSSGTPMYSYIYTNKAVVAAGAEAYSYNHSEWVVLSRLSAGSYVFKAEVDFHGEIDESNENNNVASVPFTVTAPFHPISSSISLSAAATSGSSSSFDVSAFKWKFDKSAIPSWVTSVVVHTGSGGSTYFNPGSGTTTFTFDGPAYFTVNTTANTGAARNWTWRIVDSSGNEVCTLTVAQEAAARVSLSSISISGASSVTSGSTANYTCTARMSDGTTKAVTPTWSISSGSGYASISSSGRLTANAVTSSQSVTVKASYTEGGVTKTATKTVTVNPNYSSDFEISGGVLIKYKGTGGAVAIPSSVTRIGEFAFSYCDGLTSVTIPSSVVYIDQGAFMCCYWLTSVSIPEGVKTIGHSAFAYSGLETVTIPSSVMSIGECAFYACDKLTSVTIRSGVTCIEKNAFTDCNALTSVTIPPSVTQIDGWAFSRCSGLGSVEIPSGVLSISEGAFDGCSGLTSVKMPEGVTSIGFSAFSGCSALSVVTIPSSVTEIGVWAFGECTGIRSVVIPANVTSIGRRAFYCCDSLKTVYVAAGDSQRVSDLMAGSGFDVSGVTFIEPPGVRFNANGGTGTMSPLAMEPNKVYKLPKCTLTPPRGKRFAGWACSNGRRYDDEMLVFNLGSVTMTAIWQ